MRFLKSLSLIGVAALAVAACQEEPYTPAEPESGVHYYFPNDIATSITLTEETTALELSLCRVDAASAATTKISVTEETGVIVPDGAATVNVSFDAGAKSSPIAIPVDMEKIAAGDSFRITFAVEDEGSVYGLSAITLTASVPAAWDVLEIGDLHEVWWAEVESKKELLYRDLSENLRICKIEGCFGYETILDGGDYDVQDYIFYWNTETNRIYIPFHPMGYVYNGITVYYTDLAAFYNFYWEENLEEGSEEWFAFCDDFREANPNDYYPYYDGNGGFYLADVYSIGLPGVDFYNVFNMGSDWDFYICEGYDRVTDYNDDAHFGASSALYEGVLESMLFSYGSDPVSIGMSMRYDASYLEEEEEEEISTTYYLADYFAPGRSLAFTAPVPEQLSDGAKVRGVDNEQNAGIQVMGQDLYVTVTGGSVSLAGEFPTFSIELDLCTKDADGNVLSEFGQITEVYKAYEYGKDGYTIDDIWGAYKEDYLGVWTMFSTDTYDGVEYEYEVTISDAGSDEDGEWVKISNLAGFDGAYGLVDELYALYDDYYGTLDVYGRTLDVPISYGGSRYTVNVYPADPDTGDYYSQANSVFAGICEDGALAFVNQYAGVNLSGFCYVADNLGMLTLFGNIYGFWDGGAAASARAQMQRSGNPRLKTVSVSGKAVKKSGTAVAGAKRARKVSARAQTPRSVNVGNCTRSEKQLKRLTPLSFVGK